MLLHGFPDSAKLWRHIIPGLVNGGYKVIALDQRGFGESEAPLSESAYLIDKIVEDAVAVCASLLGPDARFSLLGHDWGAFVGWQLCAKHPELINKFVAISVGHPSSYKGAGLKQKLKSWYVFFFQLRVVAESRIRAGDWKVFRKMAGESSESTNWISDLSRPGRLTAALNWYRANFSLFALGKFERVSVPTLGIYSPGDVALTEEQMTGSKRFVNAEWRYERIENSSHWIPLDQPARLLQLVLAWLRA